MARSKSYSVTRSPDAERDLDLLFDFLFTSYEAFGHSRESAFGRATRRVERIKTELRALGRRPHQGTLRPALRPNLRTVTKDRAIFYFVVDDDALTVRVLAIFFGGQDHQRHMLKRLREE